MALKSHLQYERDYCNMMCNNSCHAERVAASGVRKQSVCDAVTFTPLNAYLTEIKSTKLKRFRFVDNHGILNKSKSINRPSLLAVYFKSRHSSQGKGRWVFKIITNDIMVVTNNDKSDEF